MKTQCYVDTACSSNAERLGTRVERQPSLPMWHHYTYPINVKRVLALRCLSMNFPRLGSHPLAQCPSSWKGGQWSVVFILCSTTFVAVGVTHHYIVHLMNLAPRFALTRCGRVSHCYYPIASRNVDNLLPYGIRGCMLSWLRQHGQSVFRVVWPFRTPNV